MSRLFERIKSHKFTHLVNVIYGVGLVFGIFSFTYNRLEKIVQEKFYLKIYSILLHFIIFIVNLYNYYDSYLITRSEDFLMAVVMGLHHTSEFLTFFSMVFCLNSNRKKLLKIVNEGLQLSKFFVCQFNDFKIFSILFLDTFAVVLFPTFSSLFRTAFRAITNQSMWYFKYFLNSVVNNVFTLMELLMIASFLYPTSLLDIINRKLMKNLTHDGSLEKDRKEIATVFLIHKRTANLMDDLKKVIELPLTFVLLDLFYSISSGVR